MESGTSRDRVWVTGDHQREMSGFSVELTVTCQFLGTTTGMEPYGWPSGDPALVPGSSRVLGTTTGRSLQAIKLSSVEPTETFRSPGTTLTRENSGSLCSGRAMGNCTLKEMTWRVGEVLAGMLSTRLREVYHPRLSSRRGPVSSIYLILNRLDFMQISLNCMMVV